MGIEHAKKVVKILEDSSKITVPLYGKEGLGEIL